jgi:hypothetical protein
MTAGPPILTRHPESRFHPASQAQIMRWIALGCAGVAVILARPDPHGLLPGAYEGSFPSGRSTDILGGGLLATSLLAVAAASSWSRWSHGQLRNDQGGKR